MTFAGGKIQWSTLIQLDAGKGSERRLCHVRKLTNSFELKLFSLKKIPIWNVLV